MSGNPKPSSYQAKGKAVVSRNSNPTPTQLQLPLGQLSLGHHSSSSSHVTHIEYVTVVAEKKQAGKPKAMDLMFVVDMSGSMAGSNFDRCVTCMVEILFGRGSPVENGDTIHVIGFDNTVDTGVIKPTKKKELKKDFFQTALQTAFASRRGGTAMRDAIEAGIKSRLEFCQKKKAQGKEAKPFLMMVLTDGEDLHSKISVPDLAALLAEPRVPHFHCHVISVGSNPQTERELNQLQGGKRHLKVTNIKDQAGTQIADLIEKAFRGEFVATMKEYRVKITKMVTKSSTSSASSSLSTSASSSSFSSFSSTASTSSSRPPRVGSGPRPHPALPAPQAPSGHSQGRPRYSKEPQFF